MPVVKHILTFNAGEFSPWMDSRTDIEKYPSACRLLENFLVRPQGGISKRPGFQYRGLVGVGADRAVLVEFEIYGDESIIMVIGSGGGAKFFKYGEPIQSSGSDFILTVPWASVDLLHLRWRQINDVMFFAHPDYPPMQLKRFDDTTWELTELISGRNQPFLDSNVDEAKTITAEFSTNVTAWDSAAVVHAVGDRVTESGKTWICQIAHTSSATRMIFGAYNYVLAGGSTPSVGNKVSVIVAKTHVLKPLWVESYIEASQVGQTINLTANHSPWTADHVGSYWKLGAPRGTWSFEVMLPYSSGAISSSKVYSEVLDCRSKWTFITFGNWNGKYYVQASEDNGATWKDLRAFASTNTYPKNSSAEGTVTCRTLLRLAFDSYLALGTANNPYAMLSVEDAYLEGIVKITAVTNENTATGECITPLIAGTSDVWSEGAWSEHQGYPRCIELHQNRLIMASTARSTHTVWGSAVDDYNNFKRGTDADESWAHTIIIGQREPIVWLSSDRGLIIGSGIGEFVLRGETEEKTITPEFGVAARHSSFGSHAGGTGAIQADSSTLFVEKGGSVVRELNYQYNSDRYEAGNLNLLADHLFDDEITDCAIQRRPWQVLWFVAGGKLYSLTYERSQNVAAWQRHPLAAEVISVACIRQNERDVLWCVMNHGGAELTVERLRVESLVSHEDNGKWSDSYLTVSYPFDLADNHLLGKTVVGWHNGTVIGPATLDSGFFTGIPSGDVVIGRPYTAAVMPMTPEIGLQNGSSRSREMRIHSVVPNLYKARGGKIGMAAAGPLDRLKTGDGFFTGELEQAFDGRFGKTGDICIVSDEPLPFSMRSLALKLNYFGDAG